jgi:hypothetical protein
MLVSLASSMASGCRYCQSHMSNLSSIFEVPDEKIAAVWEMDSSDFFSAAERGRRSGSPLKPAWCQTKPPKRILTS